jgi:cold shock CspA family protein
MKVPGSVLSAVVCEFDEARGTGEVEADDGSTFGFHCTAIAGGTRTIDVGTSVVLVVKAGHLGRLEASRLSPLSSIR